MMSSDYALTTIAKQDARELQALAAHSRQAREIAAEQHSGTSIVTRMIGMLKRRPALQPAGQTSLRVSPQ
jgi:hypothetical protein